jgi:putative endonuclease
MNEGKEVPTCRNSSELGRWGEALAAQYLIAGGYQILERNWRAGRTEIDLIARHRHDTVFIEVKLRSDRGPSVGLDSVQEDKQARIVRAAHRFLCTRAQPFARPRFDVICIRYGRAGWRLDHWVEAFFSMPNPRRPRIRGTFPLR